MYNLLLASAAALVVFAAVALLMHPIAASIPALLVFGLVTFFLTRRVSRAVEASMKELPGLLQRGDVEAARAKVRSLKDRWGRWQILLAGQLDAQLGTMDYLQLRWDEALPQLQKGTFQNWTAQVCIAAIHYRRERHEEAWKAFAGAARTAPKEAMVYVVWATLLSRAGHNDKALEALNQGLKSIPESKLLKDLQATLANKKPVKTKAFGEVWFQFFPEDLAVQHVMRGRKGPLPPHMVPPEVRIGSRSRH